MSSLIISDLRWSILGVGVLGAGVFLGGLRVVF